MSYTLEVPERTFPLTRHLSWRVTRVLARYPISPNQITATALVPGLASAWCFAYGSYGLGVAGAVLLVAYAMLDNADGEIARLKDQCSAFGDQFDTFGDWIVHTAFFAALGLGTSRAFGHDAWLWLGLAAAAGATINYGVKLVREAHARRRGRIDVDPVSSAPRAAGQAAVFETRRARWKYAFRVLVRTDFCLIVLALSMVDATWVLLPAAAVGAQIYWAVQLAR